LTNTAKSLLIKISKNP